MSYDNRWDGLLIKNKNTDQIGVFLRLWNGPHTSIATVGVWNDNEKELQTVEYDVRDPQESWYGAEFIDG